MHSRETRSDPIHQRPTRFTEVIRHGSFRFDGFLLSKSGEIGLSTSVGDVRVFDDKVGFKHGGREFVAVGTVAEEGFHVAVAGGGL